MILLGIDPGATTGWCAYDTDRRVAIAAGEFREHSMDGVHLPDWDVCIQERPKGYGATRPDVVDAAYVAGRIAEKVSLSDEYAELTRHEVCKLLSDATHGEVRVKNNATAWAALVLLHGDGSDAKPRRKKGKIVSPGGAIGEVHGHARAALAVAVAWWLMREGQK